ncbi:MAG: ATP-binding protein [Bacteroidota bacterium]
MQPLDLLAEKLKNLDLTAESKEELSSLLDALKKTMVRNEFAVHRLQSDKLITEDFLNTTIIELEQANSALKVYQQKELEEKEKKIRFQESQLKQITDAMPSSLAFVDKDFKYQTNNRVYYNWFGKNTGELIGKHVTEVLGKEGFKKNKPLMLRAMNGEKIEFEFNFVDKSQQDLILQVTYTPAYDEEGQIIGLYVYGQDITRMKRNENAIENKNKELQKYIETNLQLENFAYLASHDLRSPLSNVLNFVKLLKTSAGHKLSENELKFLEYINQGSERMKEFIEALLAYSLSTYKEIEFSVFDMNALATEVLSDIELTVRQSDARVNVSRLPKTIIADRILLKQLLQNLLTNAIKFVDNDVTPVIEFYCKEKSKSYLFAVKDNGVGIAKPYQEVIFGIFKRLHTRSEYQGTGIGLSNCKNAVEKHGGTIWVESEENKGSTFYFTIPKISPKKITRKGD